jgi:hypothetical protein
VQLLLLLNLLKLLLALLLEPQRFLLLQLL